MKVKESLWIEEDENMSLCPPSKPAFIGVSEGTHVAICSMIADMGMQETNFGAKHQVYFRFEVPGERAEWTDDEGKQHTGPRSIGKSYTFSMNEKATLRQHLESWRGRSFTDNELMDADGNPIYDVSVVAGKPCQLAVVKSDKGNSLIKSIMGLPKGLTAPALEGPIIIYDRDHADNYDKLPKWMQEAIAPYSHSATPAKSEPVKNDSFDHANQDVPFDDDLPF
jgi:hypothetical protein